jgi:colicin import membrane protein
MLALTVHLLLFSFLYFGFRWQSHPPETFMVEMWESLPNAEVIPEPEPIPPVMVEPAPPPPKIVAPVLPPVEAEIEVRDKKSQKAEKKEKQAKQEKAVAAAKEKLEKEKEEAAAAAKANQEKEQRELDEYVARRKQAEQERIQAEQERVRAEVNAATRVQIERYQGLIRNKIRGKMKAVPDVPESAEAIFKITSLPDGTVMEVELQKSSGFPAYDNAAERAIKLAEPLPLPTDKELQKMFRELRLTIRP